MSEPKLNAVLEEANFNPELSQYLERVSRSLLSIAEGTVEAPTNPIEIPKNSSFAAIFGATYGDAPSLGSKRMSLRKPSLYAVTDISRALDSEGSSRPLTERFKSRPSDAHVGIRKFSGISKDDIAQFAEDSHNLTLKPVDLRNTTSKRNSVAMVGDVLIGAKDDVSEAQKQGIKSRISVSISRTYESLETVDVKHIGGLHAQDLDPAIQKFRKIHDHDALHRSNSKQPQIKSIADPVYEAQLDKISTSSHIMDLRAYQKMMIPPALTLDMIPDDEDREVFSEFDNLCNELLSLLSELETSVEEIAIWKDNFIKQSAPSSVKLQLVLLYSRLFRSKSDLHEPFFELIKQIRIYSRPWSNRKSALIELEKDYHRHRHFMDIAIRKSELLQAEIDSMRCKARIKVWQQFLHKVINSFPDFKYRADESEMSIRLAREYEEQENQRRALEWARLKATIREYIPAPSTSWIHRLQISVRKFSKIFRKNFEVMTQEAFVRGRQLFKPNHTQYYCSMITESLTVKSKPIQKLKRTHSLFNIGPWMRDNNKEIKSPSYQPAAFKKHIRANSFDAYMDIASQAPQLARAIHLPLDGQYAENIVERLKQAYMHNNAPDMWPVDDTEKEHHFQEEADISDVDSYGDFDNEPIENAKRQEANAEIAEFIQEHLKTVNQNPSAHMGHKILADVDGERDVFTFKDIIELTLLHSQQAQLMQNEYESRVMNLEDEIQAQKVKHQDEIEDLKKKLDFATERAQSLVQEFNSKLKEDEEKAEQEKKERKKLEDEEKKKREDIQKLKKALLEAKANQSSVEKAPPVKNILAAPNIPKVNAQATDRLRSVAQSKPSIQSTSHIPMATTKIIEKPKRYTELQPIKSVTVNPVNELKSSKRHSKPLPPVMAPIPATVFQGLNFYDRLHQFTENKLKNHEQLREKIRRAEKLAYEQKLAHLSLLKKCQVELSEFENTTLPAEFMPLTTHLHPNAQMAKIQSLGINPSPWGGKFKIGHPEDHHHEQINVLNLFDMTIMAPETAEELDA